MLRCDVEKRYSLADVLESKWMKGKSCVYADFVKDFKARKENRTKLLSKFISEDTVYLSSKQFFKTSEVLYRSMKKLDISAVEKFSKSDIENLKVNPIENMGFFDPRLTIKFSNKEGEENKIMADDIFLEILSIFSKSEALLEVDDTYLMMGVNICPSRLGMWRTWGNDHEDKGNKHEKKEKIEGIDGEEAEFRIQFKLNFYFDGDFCYCEIEKTKDLNRIIIQAIMFFIKSQLMSN